MSDSIEIAVPLEEGHYIETDDHVYRIKEIKDDGSIKTKRLDSGNREYTKEELSRILKFTQEIKIRRDWG